MTHSAPSRNLLRCARSVPWAVLALGALAALAACKKKTTDQNKDAGGGGVEDLTIVVEADKSRILQEEQSLAEKRETVEKERERLSQERKRIEEELASLSKKDRKTRGKLESEEKRLETEERALRSRIDSFEGERAKLEREKTQLLEKITEMTATSKGGLTIDQREARIAQREKEVAKRESKIGEREKEIAQVQADAVKALETLNKILAGLEGGGITRTVIVNNPSTGPAAGSAATKKDIDRIQKQIFAKMDTKGILMADLPPVARENQDKAKKASADKDFGTAEQALGDLDAIVSSIKIDHEFVQAKFTRINRSYQGRIEKLDEGKKKQVLTLLDDVSDSFSDGRYDRANRKINQIHQLLEGGGD